LGQNRRMSEIIFVSVICNKKYDRSSVVEYP
jgi:hypothetical protein